MTNYEKIKKMDIKDMTGFMTAQITNVLITNEFISENEEETIFRNIVPQIYNYLNSESEIDNA